MAKDKYKATWISHSSISDFLKCPRLYYLRNVYKDPKSGNKITIMSPPLALGQVVHEVIENLSFLPVGNRLDVSLPKQLEVAWKKVGGELGGFRDKDEETEYLARGKDMLVNIEKNPGPVLRKAVKIRSDGGLPYYWLDEKENIILCGKIDWLEYIEKHDSVRIIDFKTGKHDEKEGSLQLPIYLLLVNNTQKREVDGLSYWYIARESGPRPVDLPEEEDALERVSEVANRIHLARKIGHFKCKSDGCFACDSLERVLRGEGKKVGISEYRQDIYVLP